MMAEPDTQALVPRRGPERLETEQIKYISSTEFVPKSYRNNLPAIMACLAYGRELGLGDMEALRSINIIDGKPSMGAETMVRLVRRRGHSITGVYQDGEVVAHGKRADNSDEITVRWTREMAERAGLLKKDNWQKYPESMLWARAVSQLCRMLFPDCLSGLVYTPDEVELTPEERVLEQLQRPAVPDTEPPDDSSFGGVTAAPDSRPVPEADNDAAARSAEEASRPTEEPAGAGS
jgi:RecT family